MAGEVKFNRSQTLTGAGISIGGISEQLSVNNPQCVQLEIAASQTNYQLLEPDVDLNTCICMAIIANKACTVKTNSTSDPDDTLSLAANVPLIWMSGDLDAAKFLSANVSNWYITTGNTVTTLKILIGNNAIAD